MRSFALAIQRVSYAAGWPGHDGRRSLIRRQRK
jgi:hypothetical protein